MCSDPLRHRVPWGKFQEEERWDHRETFAWQHPEASAGLLGLHLLFFPNCFFFFFVASLPFRGVFGSNVWKNKRDKFWKGTGNLLKDPWPSYMGNSK